MIKAISDSVLFSGGISVCCWNWLKDVLIWGFEVSKIEVLSMLSIDGFLHWCIVADVWATIFLCLHSLLWAKLNYVCPSLVLFVGLEQVGSINSIFSMFVFFGSGVVVFVRFALWHLSGLLMVSCLEVLLRSYVIKRMLPHIFSN